ncbi:MAG: hypothetical protein ACREP9_14425, partial [Candidatus Dormibacteraceae bacterium]
MKEKSNGQDNKTLGGSMRSLRERIDQALAMADCEAGLIAPSYIGAPVPRLDGSTGTSVAEPVGPSRPKVPTTSTLGVPGTPITGGFLLDLGEYNPELMGRNAIPSYEKMRRGDAQVRATLAACKLPVQSARWNVTSPSSAYGEAAKPAAVS